MIRDFIVALGLVGRDARRQRHRRRPVPAGHRRIPGARSAALVLTNCDAFDKFPPFPFTVVFALLRGPISIKLLFEQMRLKALRHSPLGFGLLVHPDAAADRILAGALPARTSASAETWPRCCATSPRPI